MKSDAELGQEARAEYKPVNQKDKSSLIQRNSDDMEFDAREGDEVVRMNFLTPNLSQRCQLYLKPKNQSSSHFVLLLADTFVCWSFLFFQFAWATTNSFPSVNERVMFYLVCYGLVACVFAYCLMDGLRFCKSWTDRVLYVLSCAL